MQELINLGLSDKMINNMLELNSNIKNIDNKEIIEKIDILKNINCYQDQILNIITTNSLYFNKTNTEIIDLIKYLLSLGFNFLNLLFDSNPFILNLEPFEINNYVIKRKEKGEKIMDIIYDLEANTYLFNEM